jgi:hypothetical protein
MVCRRSNIGDGTVVHFAPYFSLPDLAIFILLPGSPSSRTELQNRDNVRIGHHSLAGLMIA